MKHFSSFKSVNRILPIFLLLMFSILGSQKTNAQTYTEVAGVYQAYQDGDPFVMEGMNMYYAFNKNGLVFLAFGSSSGRAFADVSGGIKSERIMTGNFSMSGNEMTMRMKKGTRDTYWSFDPSRRRISSNSITLVFVDSL